MATELEDLIELINAGTNAYSSYADARFTSAKLISDRQHQKEMKMLAHSLANQRYQNAQNDALNRQALKDSVTNLTALG